jgi:hypothetical protein
MGLYFKGRAIQEETVLAHLLGRGVTPQRGINYTCKHVGHRVWIWTNLQTGKEIVTGDKGNGWCVELSKKTTDLISALVQLATK